MEVWWAAKLVGDLIVTVLVDVEELVGVVEGTGAHDRGLVGIV